MQYTNRQLRRRGSSGDKWEVVFSFKDPISGRQRQSYHTVEASTEGGAKKKRDELRFKLEKESGLVSTGSNFEEFLIAFLDRKEKSKTIEPSTIRGYRGEIRLISSYIGSIPLPSLDIPTVSTWMADMSHDGYAPKSCAKAFRLLKQALKDAAAQDLIAKNPVISSSSPKGLRRKSTHFASLIVQE
jgi:integrase